MPRYARYVRINVALNAIASAGAYLADALGRVTSGTDKNLWDLVSEADRKSEKIIVSRIANCFPNDGFLTEESDERKGGNCRWMIDPLDGTHNFLAGLWEFSCGLALEVNGQIVFGVCLFPMRKELFQAERKAGARLNGKRIHVSGAKELKGQMFFPDSALRHAHKKILGDIDCFSKAGCRPRIYGSTHFALTRVACGQGLIATCRVFGPWDIAPASIIVQEAGGKVTDGIGRKWKVSSKTVLATNGLVHAQALRIFKGASQ